MRKKNKREDDLDTETTIVDMNVEGFRWYDPTKKSGEKKVPLKISRREYWRMVRGAFAAYAPMIICIVVAFLIVFGLAYLWLS